VCSTIFYGTVVQDVQVNNEGTGNITRYPLEGEIWYNEEHDSLIMYFRGTFNEAGLRHGYAAVIFRYLVLNIHGGVDTNSLKDSGWRAYPAYFSKGKLMSVKTTSDDIIFKHPTTGKAMTNDCINEWLRTYDPPTYNLSSNSNNGPSGFPYSSIYIKKNWYFKKD